MGLSDGGTGTLWSERVRLSGAEAVASYTSGPLAGGPAVTRNSLGSGASWYVATLPGPTAMAALLDRICEEAGVEPVRGTPQGVEAVVRRGPEADYLFLINHTDRPAHVAVASDATELLTGRPVPGAVSVPAGETAVVREPR